MSNRVQRGGEGGALEWYTSIPPITRYFATGCLLTSIGLQYGIVPAQYVLLDWSRVLRLEVGLGLLPELQHPCLSYAALSEALVQPAGVETGHSLLGGGGSQPSHSVHHHLDVSSMQSTCGSACGPFTGS